MEVVIASAVRTGNGRFGGKLKEVTADRMGAAVIREAVARTGLEGQEVNEVIFGSGWQAGVGANPARLCSVRSGLPETVPAFSVNIRCGSSLRAAMLGAQTIIAGDAEVVVAGGTESTSNVPYALPDARWGMRMGDRTVVDLLHYDGFKCPLAGMLMGATAEILVEEYGITRAEQDQFALESHQKAVRAIQEGRFAREMVEVPLKKGVFLEEEIPRPDANLEALAKLPPVFKAGGTVTAGNSCAMADAASAVVLMSRDKARDAGIKPLAVIRGYSYVALAPDHMGLGPAKAIPAALKKAGLTLADMDLIEVNEAFAAQVIACERELRWDRSRLNVHGGAVAMGHPVAATGTKILATTLYALQAYDKTLAVVSLCIGGGQGVAMVVERLN